MGRAGWGRQCKARSLTIIFDVAEGLTDITVMRSTRQMPTARNSRRPGDGEATARLQAVGTRARRAAQGGFRAWGWKDPGGAGPVVGQPGWPAAPGAPGESPQGVEGGRRAAHRDRTRWLGTTREALGASERCRLLRLFSLLGLCCFCAFNSQATLDAACRTQGFMSPSPPFPFPGAWWDTEPPRKDGAFPPWGESWNRD